jgi:hypothetical protein
LAIPAKAKSKLHLKTHYKLEKTKFFAILSALPLGWES